MFIDMHIVSVKGEARCTTYKVRHCEKCGCI